MTIDLMGVNFSPTAYYRTTDYSNQGMASIGLEPILREEMDFESIASANSAKRPIPGLPEDMGLLPNLSAGTRV